MLRPFPHPVACCCAKSETGQTFSYVQTDATTPHIVGPIMLLVVASVCTLLPTWAQQLPTLLGKQCSNNAPKSKQHKFFPKNTENGLTFLSNSPTKFFKKMYGDQFGEFVCGYWGLMSIIGLKQKKSG